MCDHPFPSLASASHIPYRAAPLSPAPLCGRWVDAGNKEEEPSRDRQRLNLIGGGNLLPSLAWRRSRRQKRACSSLHTYGIRIFSHDRVVGSKGFHPQPPE